MFPVLIIAIGIAVLAFGKRLSVLGAAIGALLGVALLRFFPGSGFSWLEIIIPLSLDVIGFFVWAHHMFTSGGTVDRGGIER